MRTEIQNKHLEKKKLKKNMKCNGIQLKLSIGLILCNTFIYQISEAVNSRLKVISLRHNNKINLEKMNNRKYTDKLYIITRLNTIR